MNGLDYHVGFRSVLNSNQLQSFGHMFLILLTFLEVRFKKNFEVCHCLVSGINHVSQNFHLRIARNWSFAMLYSHKLKSLRAEGFLWFIY